MKRVLLGAVAALAAFTATASQAASLLLKGVVTTGVYAGQDISIRGFFERTSLVDSPYPLFPGVDRELSALEWRAPQVKVGDVTSTLDDVYELFISWGPGVLTFDYEGDQNLEIQIQDPSFYGLKRYAGAVTGGGGYWSFGGESFDFTVTSLSVVPEPATWAMMLAGFAGMGAAIRRRRGGEPAIGQPTP